MASEHDLDITTLLSAVKTGEISDAEAIQRLVRSPHWVCAAIDPVTKLLLTVDVGDHTLVMAQRMVHQVVEMLAFGCVSLFLPDGFKEYTTALLTHFGYWVQPPRIQAKGLVPMLRWMSLPQLLYAQVIKTVRRRRLVRVCHRVVFGTLEGVQVSSQSESRSWDVDRYITGKRTEPPARSNHRRMVRRCDPS